MERSTCLAIHDYPADYLDPIYDCPECGTPRLYKRKKCRCFQQKIRHILYDPNIESVAGTESFSAFRREYYSTQKKRQRNPRENIENVLSASHSFIESFDSKIGAESLDLIEEMQVLYEQFLSNCIWRTSESLEKCYLPDCLSVF